jgi:hypothetical protein
VIYRFLSLKNESAPAPVRNVISHGHLAVDLFFPPMVFSLRKLRGGIAAHLLSIVAAAVVLHVISVLRRHGAGNGDRTRLTSLGSWDITTMLCPPRLRQQGYFTLFALRCKPLGMPPRIPLSRCNIVVASGGAIHSGFVGHHGRRMNELETRRYPVF